MILNSCLSELKHKYSCLSKLKDIDSCLSEQNDIDTASPTIIWNTLERFTKFTLQLAKKRSQIIPN